MFPPLTRKLFILAVFSIGIYQYSQGDAGAFVYLTATALLIYFDIRCGSMLLAYSAFRRQDFAQVRKLINGTFKPEWLRPSSRACYHFLSGILCTIDEGYAKARDHYLQAANRHLKPKHLLSLSYCALADISLHLNDPGQARDYLEQAKSFPDKDGISDMIAELEKKLPTAGKRGPAKDKDAVKQA